MSILRARVRHLAVGAEELARIAQEQLLGSVVRKFRAQKTFIRSVLEQSPDEIRHARQQLAVRHVDPHPVAPLHDGVLQRVRHAVEHLHLVLVRREAAQLRQRHRAG